MFVLNPDARDLRFPPVDLASPEGLLAIGGDLRAERLLIAYRQGIFPWYSQGQPILWWSPDPRAALFPARLRIARSLAKTLRKKKFRVSLDTAFRDVIAHCALPRRASPNGGTWITAEMLEAYCLLHSQGYAHSVETWHEGQLVGGLYGVALGGIFFGESMFSQATDASKVALAHLVRQLERWDFLAVDCQLPTPHLESLGTTVIRRRDYLALLAQALQRPDRLGTWHFDSDLAIV